eukprot:SAG22_NODE_3536_length_1655_cov_28.163882_2_plen_142_part_00
MLVGTHDFTSFAVRHADDPRSPIKTMRKLTVERDGGGRLRGPGLTLGFPVVTIVAECDRFLYHMMRIISGTLIQVGMGRLTEAAVAEMIRAQPDLSGDGSAQGGGAGGEQKRRGRGRGGGKAADAYCAPPQGLCLDEVFYD